MQVAVALATTIFFGTTDRSCTLHERCHEMWFWVLIPTFAFYSTHYEQDGESKGESSIVSTTGTDMGEVCSTFCFTTSCDEHAIVG